MRNVLRGRGVAPVAGLLVAVAIAATALAGHGGGDVKSYTGCLVSKDGVIIKIKEGNVPSSPCTGGMMQVHFGGGDITKISVGGGLSGGGDNGEVTISLDPTFSLPQGCASQQVAKWSGSAWACAADNDTTYTAGTGLQLSGTQFGVHPDYRVKNTPDCPAGQFATGFDSGGNIQCGAATAVLQGFQASQGNFLDGLGVPDDGMWRTYVTVNAPAGTYLVTGKGRLSQGDDDQGFIDILGIACRIGNRLDEYVNFPGKDNEPDDYPFALTAVVTTTGAPLTLQCIATHDLDKVTLHNATLTAVKLG